jgi:hypothetical protein
LLGLFFDPEEGGDMFFRKIGRLSTSTWHYIPENEKKACLEADGDEETSSIRTCRGVSTKSSSPN